jgi:hypothetical protein
VLEVEGNNPGVGRTAGGIDVLGGGVVGVVVVAVADVELAAAGGVGFFVPKIRASSPCFFGGSCV